MVVVTTTTTTAAVTGIKATAVVPAATRGNSCTAANVNALTPVSRRRGNAAAHVEVHHSRLTAVVTITTTIAVVIGTAVTVAALPVISGSGFIVASASAWIQNSRRQTSALVAKEVVRIKHGWAMAGATT